jgi:hypothetical protein
MGQPTLTLLDQDVSAYVTTWGKLEAVRKLKLSDSTLFAAKMQLTLDNTKGYFTPGGANSMLPRVGWAGAPAVLTRDGVTLYSGYIWDLSVDDEASQVTLDLSTSMTSAADVVASLDDTGLNPAMACLGLLEQAGLGDLLNRASFSVAAGTFGTATVDVVSPSEDGETCLGLASKISDICSLDFILARGQVYCLAQQAWDGGGLRQEINGGNSYSFESLVSDAANMANRVEFGWGAAQTLTLDDEKSQWVERRVISTVVDATNSAIVRVTDAASALFLGKLLLSRTSPRRMLLGVKLGPDFKEVLPSWRFPVTYPGLGLTAAPFEVNETQIDLDEDTISATLQSLEAQQ